MFIIIPAYEPDQRLVTLVATIKDQVQAQMIVVNDGSGPDYDHFYQEASALGAQVLTHEVNRGKGAALKTAFAHVKDLAQAHDVVVTVDSDGQHLVADMIKVAKAAQNHPQALVLGSRAFVGQVPLRSRFGNRLTAKLFQWVTGQAVSDTQTGLRAFHAKLLPWLLSLDGQRFEYEFNMLLEAKRAGYALVEEAIATVYIEDNKSSHFRPVQDSLRIYAPFITFMASASAAAVVDVLVMVLAMALTKNLLFSVVLARVTSAAVQYSLNANLVFKQKQGSLVMLARYGALVVAVLACNYLLMQGFLALGLGLLIAKLVTEILLFLVSYRLQQTYVFA